MSQTIDAVFRDYNTQSVPASGDHEPVKPEIRALLKQIQNAGGMSVTRNTFTALSGVTPPTENYMGVVLDDPDATKNGYYSRVSSAWVWERGFPDTFARLTLAGTGTARTATVEAGVNPSSVLVYFGAVNANNSGSTTLSIAGGTARSVVNAAGNALSAGEWTGVVMFFLNDDGEYQLINDAGAAAAAAASATLAQGWAAAAEVIAIPDAFTQGITGAVADVGSLRGLSTTRYKSANVHTTGRRGHFDWDASNLAFILITKTVVTTSVSGDVFTLATHRLATGNVVMPTASVNGLTANTKYWVITLSGSTFSLASSYANARAGTAVTLSGTTNATFRRLLDPEQGVFVIPTGLAFDGSQGAWVRRVPDANLDPRWFGAVVDGTTDDRNAIMSAYECAGNATTGWGVNCPPGTYGFNGEMLFYRNVNFKGGGLERTVFKNLGSGAGLRFERHGNYGPDFSLNTSYADVGGFSVDQNGAAGIGFFMGAQYSQGGDLLVKNQGGSAWAIEIIGATLGDFRRIHCLQCNNGVHLSTLYYPRIGSMSIEAIAGQAFFAETVIAPEISGLYLDIGNAAGTRPETARFSGCFAVNIYALDAELSDTAGLTPDSFILVENTNSFNVFGGRINHYSAQGSKAIFGVKNTRGFNLENLNWIEDKASMYLVRSLGTGNVGISLSNILAENSSVGSRFGFYSDAFSVTGLSITNWVDAGGISTHYIDGANVLVQNTLSTVNLNAGSWHTLINCRGTNTGTVAASSVKLNST